VSGITSKGNYFATGSVTPSIGPRSILKSLRFSFVECRLEIVPSRKSASGQRSTSRNSRIRA
jgi:hypothetical protein